MNTELLTQRKRAIKFNTQWKAKNRIRKLQWVLEATKDAETRFMLKNKIKQLTKKLDN